MRAKFINEGVNDFLKPKEKLKIDQEIIDTITSINIREDAIAYVTNLLYSMFTTNSPIPEKIIDVKQEIIDYISENEFNEALVYIVKNYFEEKFNES
jgi:hypothetical protein